MAFLILWVCFYPKTMNFFGSFWGYFLISWWKIIVVSSNAFLTWQNCLIVPAVSPWIQMSTIYLRQWRRLLLKSLDKAEHMVNTHSCGQRNKCLSPVCQVYVSPPVSPALSFIGLSLWLDTVLLVERDCFFSLNTEHDLFSWNRINKTHSPLCSS